MENTEQLETNDLCVCRIFTNSTVEAVSQAVRRPVTGTAVEPVESGVTAAPVVVKLYLLVL